MALARLNMPGLVLYGGSIAPGTFQGHDVTIQDVFEAVGAHAAGKMTDAELCATSRTTPVPAPAPAAASSPPTRWRWRCEFLGALADGQRQRAGDASEQGRRSPRQRGALVMDLLRRGVRPRDILTRDGVRERDRRRRRQRRLDQRRAAPAGHRARSRRAARHRRLRPRSARRTPLLADLKPGGSYVATDLHTAGGMPLVAQAARRGRAAARRRA